MWIRKTDKGKKRAIGLALFIKKGYGTVCNPGGWIEMIRNRCSICLQTGVIVWKLIDRIVIILPIGYIGPEPMLVIPTKLVTMQGCYFNLIKSIIGCINMCTTFTGFRIRLFLIDCITGHLPRFRYQAIGI